MNDCNLHENQRKAGTLCRSMSCTKCPPYRVNQVLTVKPVDGEVFYELEANKLKSLSSDIASAINKRSLESCLNMPDFLIADYLVECFVNLVEVTRKNARWHK